MVAEKLRYGKLVVYLKYNNPKNTNRLKTTYSIDCYLNEAEKAAVGILSMAKAEKITKVTFNGRLLNLSKN